MRFWKERMAEVEKGMVVREVNVSLAVEGDTDNLI